MTSAVTQIYRRVSGSNVRKTWYLWPAAAVIPAPIAYIKVVAVKKLVVEFWTWLGGLFIEEYFLAESFLLANYCAIHLVR